VRVRATVKANFYIPALYAPIKANYNFNRQGLRLRLRVPVKSEGIFMPRIDRRSGSDLNILTLAANERRLRGTAMDARISQTREAS
jgi:hypothetical protein